MAGLGVVRSPLVIAFTLLVGLGLGTLFALCLLLPVRSARSADEAARQSAAAFGIGYLVAAFGPVATGLARGWSGSFAPGFLATTCILLAAAFLARGLTFRVPIGAVEP